MADVTMRTIASITPIEKVERFPATCDEVEETVVECVSIVVDDDPLCDEKVVLDAPSEIEELPVPE
jgi:hypothetical protein